MATLRQKKVAKVIIESVSHAKATTAKEVLRSVGYGTGLQNQPNRVFQSEGVQQELKAYGFDSDKAKEVVAEILLAGENDAVKLKAADMIFKVNSDYAAEKHVNVNIDTTPNEIALHAAEQAYIQHLDATPEPTQSP